MRLPPDQLGEIERLLQRHDPATAPLAALRQAFPQLKATQCDASDLGLEAPYRAFASFDLHLVDGADHCWRLTEDPSRATAVLIALHGRRP